MGNGFLIGLYTMDVYGEAARSGDGYVEIDFLSGDVRGGPITESLQRATDLYCAEFSNFCKKHGASDEDFVKFNAKFWIEYDGRHCQISIEDNLGYISEVDYFGDPPKRIRKMDKPGGVRASPIKRPDRRS